MLQLTVTRVWWAFQVSQASVETLFGWGEKTFTWFYSKFIQETEYQISSECPSFMEDITKNILVFFSVHIVV